MNYFDIRKAKKNTSGSQTGRSVGPTSNSGYTRGTIHSHIQKRSERLGTVIKHLLRGINLKKVNEK